jgi:hypothetical protein
MPVYRSVDLSIALSLSLSLSLSISRSLFVSVSRRKERSLPWDRKNRRGSRRFEDAAADDHLVFQCDQNIHSRLQQEVLVIKLLQLSAIELIQELVTLCVRQ